MSQKARVEVVGAMDAPDHWAKATRVWIPEVDIKRKIRLDRLKRELGPEELGRRDGRENLPATTDTTLNEPQREICGRVFSGVLMLNQFLAEQLAAATREATARPREGIGEEDAASRIRLAVETSLYAARTRLGAARLDDLAASRDLRYFQQTHRLDRPAKYRESMVLVAAIIIALVLLEAVANGLLLSQVTAGGLLEGSGLAFAISLVNIALGLCAGFYGWRRLAHRNPTQRALGLLVTVAAHATALFWNLLVANFREVAGFAAARKDYDFDVSAIAAQAIPHMWRVHLIGLSSIFSWALLIVGVILHFIAAREGFEDIRDRYPEYAHFDRRAKTARGVYDEAAADAHKAAETAARQELALAERAQAQAVRWSEEVRELVEVAHQREREVRDSEDEWVDGGSQLLRAYRDANAQVRDAGTAPVYFTTFPNAASYRDRSFTAPGGGTGAEIGAQEEAARRNLAELATLRDEAKRRAEDGGKALARLRALLTAELKATMARVEAAKTAATVEAQAELQRDAAATA